ncbi:lipid-binding SYLF domain-containing protein [Formosa sp. PL04]|uniref:lipid-binding SYLF domain-containing protein n=1 Tax=Formosa sp. PL04 TaxID=3081755 RepID=UPI00298190AA|nr:lipid-binding SYLF domain-containing protein [Formosa sp. PL04]MDW5288538.1 lipid-binding SYLF domain-containing protein [Formosa sp. PL04]
MKTKFTFTVLLLIAISFTSYAQKNVSDKSAEAIKEFKKTNEKIDKYFSSAYGYAVFPSIGKGGLGIGGATGNGTIYKGGAIVGDCKMSQLTIGFQAGGQSYSEIIFFESKESFERFTGDKFEFSAQATAVALKSGASFDVDYRDGILIFTVAKGGLMYEASVGGQKFKTKMR